MWSAEGEGRGHGKRISPSSCLMKDKGEGVRGIELRARLRDAQYVISTNLLVF